jgi:hypothetical protein
MECLDFVRQRPNVHSGGTQVGPGWFFLVGGVRRAASQKRSVAKVFSGPHPPCGKAKPLEFRLIACSFVAGVPVNPVELLLIMRTPLFHLQPGTLSGLLIIALIRLRKQRVMSVVCPTIVDICGRFCRQTAVPLIDTVEMTNT